MRQYELTIRIAQIHHLIEVRKYKKALAVVKTLDMRQVKGISDLSAIAEVYTKTEQFDAAKNTYLRINGSDDYFLWILLVENKARGVINPEKLYVHISTGENTSLNEVSMKRSDYEVTELLSEKINWWKIHRIRRKAEYFTTKCKTLGVKLKYMDVGIFRKVYQICRL